VGERAALLGNEISLGPTRIRTPQCPVPSQLLYRLRQFCTKRKSSGFLSGAGEVFVVLRYSVWWPTLSSRLEKSKFHLKIRENHAEEGKEGEGENGNIT
jgi:hypothetical protein